jgi:hypothetical protein
VDFTNPTSLNNGLLHDLLVATIEAYPFRGDWETLQPYQDYAILRQMFKDKVDQQGGASIIFDVMATTSGAAKKLQPYQTIQPGVSDNLARGRAEYRRYETDWSVERGEILANMGEAEILKLVRTRREGAWLDLMGMLLTDFWTLPAATDVSSLWGIPYTLTPIQSGQTGGFNANAPTGYSDCYGLSPTTYSKWAPYSDRWAAAANFDGSVITDPDIVAITGAIRDCRFLSPPMVSDIETTTYNVFRMYAGKTLLAGLEERARKNNDDLGNDLMKYMGAVLVNNLPILYEPYLEKVTSGDNPGKLTLTGVNHKYFKPIAKQGMYMYETTERGANVSPLTETTFVFTEWNLVCTNRQRAGFRIDPVAA